MLFSCKISHSIVSYLERRGENLESLYDTLDVPVEFLKDPSYWLDAPKMEAFLRGAEDHFGKSQGVDFLTTVGHRAHELRSWGVLDSVLRMMQKPQDIYGQPARFISYFVSPEPPIANLNKADDSVSFELPISSDEYPRVVEYLAAAFESLPAYIGRPLAQVKWNGIAIRISWDVNQESLFGEPVKRLIKPELAETIVLSLEASQRELEEKNKELLLKNQELMEAKEKLESHMQEKIYSEQLLSLGELAAGIAHEINNPIASVLSNVHRLNDYMVRAQQLMVLLVGQERMNPQVREAMRRTDWEYVRTEFPNVVGDAVKGLRKIQDIVKDLSFLAGSQANNATEKVDTDLNQVIDNALQTLEVQVPKNVSIDRHLFLDRPVKVFPLRMEQALVNLISNAVQAIEGDGSVRVVTRPRGQRVEIEITDTGVGMDEDTLSQLFTPFFTTKQPGRGTGLGLSIARSIVKMHEGNIKVSSRKGQGSTFTIDLPM